MRWLAACFLLLAAPVLAQTAIRPDQISPATPDITWAPGGTGYQIGTTVPWRSDASTTPTFLATDAAKTVELTAPTAITATLPDIATSGTPPPFGDGFGFAIQTKSQPLTLNRFGTTQLINGLAQIKVGPWQAAEISSRGGNWYALLSVPQPTTQTGTTVLTDAMIWGTAGPAQTITAVSLSNNSFIGGTSATIGAVGVTMSPTTPTFSGTLSLSGTGSSSFLLSSTTLPSNLTTNGVVAAGTYGPFNITATQSGATGSPFAQAVTITGSAGSTAASFNGTTSYATAPLSLSTFSQVTVTFFLNWTTFANNDALAMEYTANSNSSADVAFLSDPNSSSPDTGKWDQSLASGPGQGTTAGITRPSAGAWHHYAVVFDAAVNGASALPTVYLDGVSQTKTYGTSIFVAAHNWANATLYVMSRAGTSLFGTGAMAKLAIYPVVLSAANIAAIAGGTSPATYSPVYYWTMSSGTVSSEANLGSGGTAALTFVNTATVAGP